MAKRFVFRNPEQLKAIVELCKDGSASKVMNVARVWSVTCRQKEKTPWDGKIGASFYTEGRERKACVFRFGTNDQICVLGWLKYNAALKWCEENLERGARPPGKTGTTWRGARNPAEWSIRVYAGGTPRLKLITLRQGGWRSAMVHQTEVQFLPSPQMLRGHCIAVQSDGF